MNNRFDIGLFLRTLGEVALYICTMALFIKVMRCYDPDTGEWRC